ncbi:MAG: hypothetical protein AABX66_00990 [Nanoarchaeota archaeon]
MNNREVFLAIFVFSLFSFIGLVNAVNVNSCRELNQTNTTYDMINNLEGDQINNTGCFNISAQNIVLDCKGFYIKNISLLGIGIYSNQINSTIKNCNVTLNLSQGGAYGIYLSSAHNSLLLNNTVNFNNFGLYLSSIQNLTVQNLTILNNFRGIQLTGSSYNNTFNSVTAVLNYAGVYLDNVDYNNFNFLNITSNSAGVFFNSAEYNLFNFVNSNFNGKGFDLYMNSGNNNFSYITANSNSILFDLYNAVDNLFNFVSSNLNAQTFSYSEASFVVKNSSFADNLATSLINSSLDLESVARTYAQYSNISLRFSILYPNNTASYNYRYNFTIYPSSVYLASNRSENLTINFSAMNQGIYTLKLNVSILDENITEMRNFIFLVGNVSSDTQRMYFHANQPTHGQPLAWYGSDSGSILNYPTNTSEERHCEQWVQYQPDMITFPYFVIRNISVGWFYLAYGGVSSKFEKWATYSTDGDYTTVITSYNFYKFGVNNFTRLNLTSDYLWRPYWISLKLTATTPSVLSNLSQQSFVDFTYLYTGPRIVQLSGENGSDIVNAQLLSNVFDDNDNKNATLQLKGRGNFTVALNLSHSIYNISYDGIACSLNSNCTLNSNSEGRVNVTIVLGALNTLNFKTDPELVAPVISLISPSNSFSTESTSLNFVFNVSDISNTNCSLIVDGSVASFNSSVDINQQNTTFTTSFSAGSHSWSINCTDVYGNIGNSTQYSFTITSSQSVVSSSSSGGGGGGTVVAKVYDYESTDLSNSGVINQSLALSEKIKLAIRTNGHTLTLSAINSTMVTVVIASNPQIINLVVGETKEIVLDGKILLITLHNIINSEGYKADISISSKLVNEEIENNSSQENQNVSNETIENSNNNSYNKLKIYIILIVVILIVGFLIYKLIFKKGKRTKRK